jgi:formylglycine-generating enzyme required for sulfatase activity
VPRPCWSLLLPFLVASSASAVTMAWTPVGNIANACDPGQLGCFGAVGYTYSIGTYEVTNAQYVELLNAKAASDPLGLYSPSMASGGGITRSGVSGSYTYSVVAGRGDMPVNYTSFFDAARFANWMNNGQGSGDTETGAYTLSNGAPPNVTRNLGATVFLPSEDEWYKAAYYAPGTASYFDFPAGSNTVTTCSTPITTANRANCDHAVGGLAIVGSYSGSASPYGTYDQGGNVREWNESLNGPSGRGQRGGDFDTDPFAFYAGVRGGAVPSYEDNASGFRLAMIVPEPGTGLLVIAGLLGLTGARRRARSQP